MVHQTVCQPPQSGRREERKAKSRDDAESRRTSRQADDRDVPEDGPRSRDMRIDAVDDQEWATREETGDQRETE